MNYYLMGVKGADGSFEFHGYCDQEDRDIILSKHEKHEVFYVLLEKAVTIYDKFTNFTVYDYTGIRQLFEKIIKNHFTNLIVAMKYCSWKRGFPIDLMTSLTNEIYYFYKFLEIAKRSVKLSSPLKISSINNNTLLDAIGFCDALVVQSCKFLKTNSYEIMVDHLAKLTVCRQVLMNIFARNQGKKCNEKAVDYILRIAEKELI